MNTTVAEESSLTFEDSPLPDALNIYYSSLRALCAANGFNGNDDRLVLDNTITSFDIAQDTPYFNEGLFRRFADRVYTVGSEDVVPASQADRFSYIYDNLLRSVAVQIDQRHPEIIPKIEELRGLLDKETKAFSETMKVIENNWSEIAERRKLDKEANPSDYMIQQVKYYEDVRYPDRIKEHSSRITDWVMRIEQVRRAAYTPAETLFLNTVAEMAETKKIARPLRPTFEKTTQGANSDLFYADRTKTPEALCDISLPIYPLGDLVKFITDTGEREPINIQKGTSFTHKHDESWSGGGKASIPIFNVGIGFGGGASGSSSFIKNVKTAIGISIKFENIAEVLVDRGYWFNPGLFDEPGISDMLFKHDGIIKRLRFAAASLIICRGLTLSMSSSEEFDNETWSTKNIKAKGGARFMGFKFGGSGSRTENDYTLTTSDDKRTVTFKDNSNLCRLLGVRLVDFAKPREDTAIIEALPIDAPRSRFLSEVALKDLFSGKASYREIYAR